MADGKAGQMESRKMFRTNVVGGYNKEDVDGYLASMQAEIARLGEAEANVQKMKKKVADSLEEQKRLLEQKLEEGRAENERRLAEERAEAEARIRDEYEEKLQRAAKNARQAAAEAQRKLDEEKSKRMLAVREKEELARRLGDGTKEEIDALREKAAKYDESYSAIRQLLLDSRIEAQIILNDAELKRKQIISEAMEDARQEEEQAALRLDANKQLVMKQAQKGFAAMEDRMRKMLEEFAAGIESSWENATREGRYIEDRGGDMQEAGGIVDMAPGEQADGDVAK